MTPDDLRQWRDKLGLTNEMAAQVLALSKGGFLKQLYGRRRVSRQTEMLARKAEEEGVTP